MKTEIFRDAEPSPFSEVEIDEEGEEDDPREIQKQRGERWPADQVIADNRNDERFCRQDKSDAAALLDLRRYEFLSERNHDKEGEDADGGQAGALLMTSKDQDTEDRERNNRQGDGNSREVEQAEFLQRETGDHADQDNADKNSDAVFDAIRIEGEEGKGDNGRRVDTEGLDTDDLAEKRHEGGDNRQHEQESYRLDRHALLQEKFNKRVVGHRKDSGVIQ